MAGSHHLLLASLATCFAVGSAGHDWGYRGNIGPAFWHHKFLMCNGTRQSPINLDTSSMKSVKFSPLRLHHYTHTPASVLIKNNGHSLYVEVTQEGMDPVMTEGGLVGDYVFHSLHFHWGSESSRGSEHTVNGKEYPLEMHLVHSNGRYGSVATAMQNPDGLAVLGVLFELSSSDNEALGVIIDEASKLKYVGNNLTLTNPGFTLKSLLPNTNQFYRYLGSLTTPTCDEIVTWTLLEAKNTISENQLKKLRSMTCGSKSGHGGDGHGSDDQKVEYMSDNYRPLQKLKGRHVSRRDIDSSSLDSSRCVQASVLMVAVASLLSRLV